MGSLEWKNKKTLVTGGNGFLGRNLIKKLLGLGAEIFSIDLNHEFCLDSVSCHNIDLLDRKKLKSVINEMQPSLIYHLAANLDRTRDISKANSILDINVKGTLNLLEALQTVKYENFIFTSTSEVYGGEKTKLFFSENDDFVPASPYALSKFCAEMSVRTFSAIHKKNFTILRLFNFYGEQMPKEFFLPQLIDKLKRNEKFDMTKGEQIRDYLHINDVIDSLLIAIKSEAYNDIFNVCSGTGVSIKELAIQLKGRLNSKSEINFGAIPYRKNEVWEMIGDNSKITKLGFRQKTDLFGEVGYD